MHRLPAVFDPEFPVPTVFQHEEGGPVRPKSVDVHVESPARAQYPENLFDHTAGVIKAGEKTTGIYTDKTLIREWGICDPTMQKPCKNSHSLTLQTKIFRRY